MHSETVLVRKRRRGQGSSSLEEKDLKVTEHELEEHIKRPLGDHEKNVPLSSPRQLPHPAEPAPQFDTILPRWAEISQVVDKAVPELNAYPTGYIRAVLWY